MAVTKTDDELFVAPSTQSVVQELSRLRTQIRYTNGILSLALLVACTALAAQPNDGPARLVVTAICGAGLVLLALTARLWPAARA